MKNCIKNLLISIVGTVIGISITFYSWSVYMDYAYKIGG